MKTWLLAIIVGTALTLGALAPIAASAATAHADAPPRAMAPATMTGAASFAGTRVKVQLVTLGAVLVLVVGLGPAAYLVRKKLGLDIQAAGEEPPPSHH